MATSRIIPLTEYALLNSTVLDIICPPNCAKLRIQSVGDSALETLEQAKKNPYANQINRSYFHVGTKPLKAAARVLYTALVTCTISPLGTLGYGLVTTACLAKYGFKVYKSGREGAHTEWDKTKEYAKAFFTDLTCFIAGAAITTMLAGSSLILLNLAGFKTFMAVSIATYSEVVWQALGSVLLVAAGFFFFGGFSYESAMPKLIAWEEERVGMYLALSLRNKLGLVDENGGLLKFSERDRLEYDKIADGFQRWSYRFKGTVDEQLAMMALNAELELLDKVREANHLLVQKGHAPITYTYPFDGNKVATLIQQKLQPKVSAAGASLALATYDPKGSLASRLVQELRTLDYKVNTFKELHRSAKEVTLEDSVWMLFVKALGRQGQTTITIPVMKSYVNEAYYRETFHTRITVDASGQTVEIKDLAAVLGSCPLLGIPENTPLAVGATHYAEFKHRVCINKGCLDREEDIKTPLWMLGLAEDCSYDDYKRAIRKYQLAVHPDKNADKIDEAKALFQVSSVIKEFLDKKFNG